MEKTYWAIVEGEIKPATATLEHWLRKDERHRKMHTTSANTPGAVQAILAYRLVEISSGYSLLEIRPQTGRKHQIRVQLAKHGYPIVGDRKYGSGMTFAPGIALHAKRLVVDHPVQHVPLELEAELPRSWQRFTSR